MNPILRRAAVSTAAAVALVGSTATITTADAAEHETTVVAIARTDTQPGIGTGLTPAGGTGSPLQGPNTQQQMPTGVGQQVTTQASGGAIGVGVVAILVLGIIVFVRVKHRDIKPGDAVLVGLFGIALSGTVIGAMGNQLTGSAVSSLSNVLGGL